MTQDEIIEMARQAGFEHIAEANYWHPLFAKFANLVAQHEREQCIKAIEDQIAWDLDDPESTAIKAIKKKSGV
jgi:hypothetical protein